MVIIGEIIMAKKNTNIAPSSRGGLETVRRYGTSWMSEIGSRGGKAVAKKYGSEYLSNLGTLGADVVNNHLSKTARLRTERTLRRIIQENN